ncbi:hypothetical protein FLAG1_09181 [Fusarium langsethiae]|uniref:Uncharacterized protein n=1 Tax=Fusarium langsethiae TaxID=179993 RepID=A0A0N0DCC0_FUSLA|nr:hypothetical protein FLAG1_09181 [Fusarium langsethiae]
MPFTTSSTQRVPGLNCHVTADAVRRSRELYNLLTEDTNRPSIQDHLQNLQHIFVSHGVDRKLGIHLKHGHFQLSENQILLGTTSTKPLCRWARKRHIDDADLNNIHGHIFVVQDGELHPYEYHDGRYTESIPTEFLDAFIKYTTDHSLCSEVALQILLPEFQNRCFSEIPFEDQTVMLETEHLNGLRPGNVTGWTFSPVGCTAGETHAETGNGHEKYNVGAPLPNDVRVVCGILIDRGLLHPSCLAA